jgi:hypothetical protein
MRGIFYFFVLACVASACSTFTHPGLLRTSEDFDRIQEKVNEEAEPWMEGWKQLVDSRFSDPCYKPNPASIIYRGYDGTHAENYAQLYQDVAAAYVLAIRWSVTENSTYADAAVGILDAWSANLTEISGTVDLYLAVGIYGYEFCQAAEIMHTYTEWKNFNRFAKMMLRVFYPAINQWFVGHENWGSWGGGVYPGWDLSQIAAAVSIGVLTDNETIYQQGLNWFLNGTGNGQINNAVPYTYWYDNQVLGQPMETGRDQGHTMLDIALFAAIGQMTYNQGNDLFAHNDSIILSAYVFRSDFIASCDPLLCSSVLIYPFSAEYEARYNLGYDVPYKAYGNAYLGLPIISNSSRGNIRPTWELLYNHYGVLKGLNTTWTKKYRDMVVENGGGSEGGSGDYGSDSGGYDQLGWGTLLYTLEG